MKSPKYIFIDLIKANDILPQAGQAITLYRPPFGVTNPNIKRAVYHASLEVIGWNVRSFDTTTTDQEKIFNRIISQLVPGSIILLHDRLPGAPVITEMLIKYFNENDYKVVPLNQLLPL